jgi:hypothetical protein
VLWRSLRPIRPNVWSEGTHPWGKHMHRKVTALVATTTLVFGLATAAASAADMAVKAPVIQPFSWTGCYVGVEGGGIWGRSQHTAADPTRADFGRPITTVLV